MILHEMLLEERGRGVERSENRNEDDIPDFLAEFDRDDPYVQKRSREINDEINGDIDRIFNDISNDDIFPEESEPDTYLGSFEVTLDSIQILPPSGRSRFWTFAEEVLDNLQCHSLVHAHPVKNR